MISLYPIAVVRSERTVHQDDHWGTIVSTVTLLPEYPAEMLDGIESFSHLEFVFHMNQVESSKICRAARHPRNNPNWPKVGILAQRARNRPNQLGVSIARLLKREGVILTVQGLDALDGTPILDIKPVIRELLPTGEISQPVWATELAREYF